MARRSGSTSASATMNTAIPHASDIAMNPRNPRILFADEPTGNLDSTTGEEIMKLLDRLHEVGNTIVLVTHEHDIAAHSRRQVHLKDGLIEKQFTPAPF